jgi:predicted alpha/beta superfamily hydrolase
MYRTLLVLAICLIPLSILTAQSKQVGEISIAQRYEMHSEILDETRSFNVYLPPSYLTHLQAEYPVAYLMDGDYNFYHTVGLIEQLAGISGKIPEMIVVGVADNGHSKYINNCTPNEETSNPDGQSDKFLNYLTTELRNEIDSSFRTADYSILIGHSLGGLFVVNSLLSEPTSFNAYIAISPSLWWNDYKAESKVEEFYKKYDNLNRFLYLSLANEKGMGVHGFYDQLDVFAYLDQDQGNEPLGLDYTFKQFPEENHNSVGLTTVNHALKELFQCYDPSSDAVESCENFAAFEKMIADCSQKIGSGFRLPDGTLRSLVNSFFKNSPEELVTMEAAIKDRYPASLGDFYEHHGNAYLRAKENEKAVEIHEMNYRLHPNNPEYLMSLVGAYTKTNQLDKAKEYTERAYLIAMNIGMRQWYLNELKSQIQSNK